MIRDFNDPALVREITQGAIGVIPTDTLYGIVAAAGQPAAVEKVYELKGRDAHKPCIILLDKPATALQFGVPATEVALAAKWWPAPLSVVFSGIDARFSYLLRGNYSLPFRVPADAGLREFLSRTGPLIAPSANKQGEPPASTVETAQQIFGRSVDFYVDGGIRHGAPSTIVRMQGGEWVVVRVGAFVVPESLR